jgi:glutamyl-tRNA synthetase
MTVKTRFAPSPTGYLHIGGARTALYCWLYARKTKGRFLLRIEDTDRERSTQASVDAILEGMEWLRLDYDEAPIFQTDRFDRYKDIIQQLIDQGDAYHCYCTPEELNDMRDQQRKNKEKPRYNGRCRQHSTPRDGINPVVRFRNPIDGEVVIDDLVKGKIVIGNKELDDLIIARSDGTPTYNLTVVVDDIDMQMTHVIRGDDHINNTPRQINMYTALGAALPKFAHVPMILGDDGKRLSKRHGAVGVMQYREEGYLPHAILNYLLRLGWSHGDQEIFSREEMIALFDIADVHSAPSTFNTEKLQWLNQQYIKTLPVEEIIEHLQWHLEHQALDISTGPELADVVNALRERAKSLADLVAICRYYYEDFSEYDVTAAKKNFKTATPDIMQALHNELATITDWQCDSIDTAIKATCTALDLKLNKVGPPLRVAVTGTAMSPSLDVTLMLVGRERTLARLSNAIAFNRAKYA